MARRKNPKLKSSNTQSEYGAYELNELKKCASSAIYFVENYVKIVHPKLGAVPFILHDYQKEMIESFQNNKDTVVLASRQVGKALHIKELVATPNGFSTMENLQVGDYVLGADGKPTRIIATSPIHYNRDCYKVVFSTGEEIVTDGEHLWEVNDIEDNSKNYDVITTKEIFDRIGTTPLVSHSNGVRKLYTRFKIKRSKPLQLPHCVLNTDPYVFGQQVCTTNINIPIEFLRASYEQRLELLRGIMDCIGTYNPGNEKRVGTCVIDLSNSVARDDINHLIRSLGYYVTRNANNQHFIVLNANDNPFKNSTCKDTVQHYRLPVYHYIERIELVDSVPVKCIAIDSPDKLFLVGNSLIPTHNSVSSAAFLLWYANFNFDKTILIASNKNSNAMEMVDRIKYAYENLPDWLRPGIQEDKWNKHELGFDNNSRIISTATSEDSGRGLSVALLYADELAFVADNIAEEFWTSMTPTLSTGGRSIVTSTPNGDSNLFARLWRGAESGINGYHPIFVSWDRPPGRDEAFRKEFIGKIGEIKWAQEFECHFLSSEALLIGPTFLQKMTERQKHVREKADIRGVKFWDEIKTGQTYLIGVDPATGNGSDYSVISVFSFPQLNQIAEYRSNTTSTNELYNVLKNVLLQFERKKCSIYFSIENNGVGEGIISLYEQDEKSPDNAEFISEGNKRGMTTTSKTKMRACVNFREMLEKYQLTINSPTTLMELKSYVRKKGAYAAMAGATDDCISACLIVVRLVEEISTYEQEAFDKLYSGNTFEVWQNEDGDKDVFKWDYVEDDASKDDEDFDPMPFI